MADRRVPSNDPRDHCGTHFSSSSLLVSVWRRVRSSCMWILGLIGLRVNQMFWAVFIT